jgi:hypothetical protein
VMRATMDQFPIQIKLLVLNNTHPFNGIKKICI